MEPVISTTLITPVILSGGSGTRLWPLSRSKKPKQLLALTGGRTMLQMTTARCADPARFGKAIIVTNALHAEEIAVEGTSPLHVTHDHGRNVNPEDDCHVRSPLDR